MARPLFSSPRLSFPSGPQKSAQTRVPVTTTVWLPIGVLTILVFSPDLSRKNVSHPVSPRQVVAQLRQRLRGVEASIEPFRAGDGVWQRRSSLLLLLLLLASGKR